ncbi:hypothetical protein [Candidatus Poriferisodalis sp.]|uniref:hypothetical protein n=1 Tax=Candidatus Poriferisodalis sp. TaxID=3101277 RepID=UPI003B5AEE45
MQTGDDDDEPTQGASLPPDPLECAESGDHSHPSNLSCHPRTESHCQHGEHEHLGNEEWIGRHPRYDVHTGTVSTYFYRSLVSLICYRGGWFSPSLLTGCTAALTHDLECVDGDHAHPGRVVCHSDGIDHGGCGFSTGDGATSSHFHSGGSEAHRDCQTHEEPACDPFDASIWPPGHLHADVVVAPCEVSIDGVGVEDPTTLEWNPLDGTICAYAANQGFSGASARRLCMRHHQLEVMDWNDSIEARFLTSLDASEITFTDAVRNIVSTYGRALDAAKPFAIVVSPLVGAIDRLYDQLPPEIQQPIRDLVCPELGGAAGRFVSTAGAGRKIVQVARITGTGIAVTLTCYYVTSE